MSVADLAREAPRRYLDAMPIADWAGALLDRLGTAPTLREREHVSELVAIWRRCSSPRCWHTSRSPITPRWRASTRRRRARRICAKTPGFQDATMPALVAEVSAWARAIADRARPNPLRVRRRRDSSPCFSLERFVTP